MLPAERLAVGVFQFALPRGERRRRHCNGAASGGFNSRSRVGSDVLAAVIGYLCWFQFALPRGERPTG